MAKDEKVSFSMTFEPEKAKQFEKVKQHYGLENNTEVIRILVYEKYKELCQKVKP